MKTTGRKLATIAFPDAAARCKGAAPASCANSEYVIFVENSAGFWKSWLARPRSRTPAPERLRDGR